ncbi:hypothetical protein F5Y18DRAFT_196533 [Xylariaceae sp. FL1019]|nr:hypothetical protein F5Y18DRAFT_196533 [Xylariaceae sp. FL1019]
MLILASYTPAHSTGVPRAKGHVDPAKPIFTHREGVTTADNRDAIAFPRLLELPRPLTPDPRPGSMPLCPQPNPSSPPSPQHSLLPPSHKTFHSTFQHIATIGSDIKPLVYPRPPRPPTPGPYRPGPIPPRPDVPTPPPTPRRSLDIRGNISTFIHVLTTYFKLGPITDDDAEMSAPLEPEDSNQSQSITRKRPHGTGDGANSTGPEAQSLKQVAKKPKLLSPPQDLPTWNFPHWDYKRFPQRKVCCEICTRGPGVRDTPLLEIIESTLPIPNLGASKPTKPVDPSTPTQQTPSSQPSTSASQASSS